MKAFYHLLGNTLVSSITNFTVWFALTFWVFLETQSVFATGMIAGIYLVCTALSGFWLGSIVDHNRKKHVMLGSSAVSLAFYALALLVYHLAGAEALRDVSGIALWAFVLVVLFGVIAGNIRSIALSTLVTILVPDDRRDKANGMVGTVSGIGFLTTSIISGFLVAWGGMFYALVFATILTILAIMHLLPVNVPEERAVAKDGVPAEPKRIDIRGTIQVINLVPGLFALIFFATFNNFLGGVFMALMDPYGLSLVSVQTWGVLLGVLSTAFIASGLVIAKFGLGKNPLKTLLLVNLITWSVCCVFAIQPSIILLSIGFFIWMFFGPYAEASEHTVLQRVVPLERQGRVFGFAQSIEQAASPLTAFLIGPLTQFFFIPLMTTGVGAALIGDWFGTGPARGMALVFVITGIIGLAATILALNSKSYRLLSRKYQEASAAERATASVPQ